LLRGGCANTCLDTRPALLFFSRLTLFSFCRFEALLVHQLMSEAGPLIKGGEEGAAKLVGS